MSPRFVQFSAIVALALVVGVLDRHVQRTTTRASASHHLTAPGGEHEEDGDADATYGLGALRYRLKRLRDASGRIPPNPWGRVKRQVDRIKARGDIRRIETGFVAPIGADTFNAAAATPASAVNINPRAWRALGPGNIGGRIRSIAINPSNPNEIFAGSVGGGVWRSFDAGTSWAPVDDFMAVLSVSSIVIDRSNPNTLYAGTGEGFGNADSIPGAGVFKSIDGGTTWTQLAATANWDAAVNRLALSGGVLLAAESYGVMRSTNGGGSFTLVASYGGVTDVAFDPNDANKAVASGGGGLTLYSWDAGRTWQAGTRLPNGRVEIAWARSSPNVVFASVDSGGGVLYRSNDAGATWSAVYSAGGLLSAQGWYNNAIWVNPRNSNHLIVGGVSLQQSFDGGRTWQGINGAYHPDQHAIVEDPRFDGVSNTTVYIGNDGGVFVATDVGVAGGPGMRSLNNGLAVTQFYGGAGNAASGVVLGGTQDNGTLMRAPTAGTNWTPELGGDGGFSAADPTDPNYFYGEIQYLTPYRTADGGRSWTYIGSGLGDAGSSSRANFIAPIVLDPNNPNRLFAGGASLWMSDNIKSSTPTWKAVIGMGSDNFDAVAVAPGDSNVVWAARGVASVYRATNAASPSPSFFSVTIPVWGGEITRISISPFDSNVVYISKGGFTANNILKTTNGGATWTTATGSGDTALPQAPVYDVEIDPSDANTLYAATEAGVFVSHDAGVSWDLPQDGPANVDVEELFWMGSTLVAVTHGRGMFAVDTGGGAPVLAVSPSALGFGSVNVGTSSSARALRVTNTGSAPLTVGAIQLSGSAAGQFAFGSNSCAGATLAAGASCTINVVFRPTKAATSTATVVIPSNAASSPDSVPVTGTGATAAAALPSPWTTQDVGSVGTPGSVTYASGTFTVTGSGADVWGTADAFRFVAQAVSGDVTITARVATIQNLHAWTKAGVMLRASLDAASPQASVFVTPGKGLAFQYRTTAGGTSENVSMSGTAPKWVRLQRIGTSVTASFSSDGSAWTKIGSAAISGSGGFAGLAVSSHDATLAATATFDHVSVTQASAATLPSGWATADIGSVGAAGSAGASGGTFTVKGGGADVWGSSDAFRYAYYALPADGSIVARVATEQNVDAWTKAGVMIRQSLAVNAMHASMFVTPGKGVAFQRRPSTGGASLNTSAAGTPPLWLKLSRAGTQFTASVSSDGASWTVVGQETIAMTGAAWAGLAVTSHDAGQLATATFDHVTVSASALPSGWTDADIGSTGVRGSASYANGTFTIKGSGADVWGTADAFHFASQSLGGNGQLTARVASVQNTQRWAKAGVMVRSSAAAGAPHGFMLVSAAAGVALQARTASGGVSVNYAGSAATPPRWVRIVRSGNTVSGYESADGTTWTLVQSVSIPMGTTVQIGLAVTSHDNTQLATATFDHVLRQ